MQALLNHISKCRSADWQAGQWPAWDCVLKEICFVLEVRTLSLEASTKRRGSGPKPGPSTCVRAGVGASVGGLHSPGPVRGRAGKAAWRGGDTEQTKDTLWASSPSTGLPLTAWAQSPAAVWRAQRSGLVWPKTGKCPKCAELRCAGRVRFEGVHEPCHTDISCDIPIRRTRAKRRLAGNPRRPDLSQTWQFTEFRPPVFFFICFLFHRKL